MLKKRFFGMMTVVVWVMLLFIIAGCATSVPIKSVRRPTIDTSSVKRIAIRDFQNRSGASVPVQITRLMVDRARQVIQSGGHFELVAANDPNADGIFTGEIRGFVVRDTSEQQQRKDRDGNVYSVTVYRREVGLEFAYGIISSRTNMPIGEIVKRGSNSSYAENDRSKLTDATTMALGIAESQLRSLNQDIHPTIVTSMRKLMDETSKDKIVKAKMKDALALVKNGNYDLAIEQYDSINREFGSVAARANADLLREAIASDSSAAAELNRLFNERGGPVEKAINNAVSALNTNISSGQNITIMKTSSANRGMLDRFVDAVTRNIVQEGKINVIDRANQTLIDAEQQFQLSGSVSDETAISIGKQLGVRFIVLCWISGEMSARQVNLRVLNVETAQIISQDAFDI
jgi:hypothetical protein